MAISSTFFSNFLCTQTPPFLKPSPPSTPRMLTAAASTTPAHVRIVTRATASNPATTGKREPRGIMKPRRVSPEMQALVGVPEIARTQALKQIWAYIKENNLQDPENKKVIICDEKLKKVFGGRDRIGFLEIAGLISPHFLK
ncbi:SWIB domain-containing protein [Cephalotus follicularis]|uniref:SWIB domain-containing protein n=1 Tax=Cephalotus follicularis TaxID=3775 RepID=A0A1Q3C0F4_CEPFO|nr:SWIB domain-containing protein [Cephalotus follicularis]